MERTTRIGRARRLRAFCVPSHTLPQQSRADLRLSFFLTLHRATIRKFLAAATFIEVAKSFGEGELDPDVRLPPTIPALSPAQKLNIRTPNKRYPQLEAKLKYSRFKAASLSKSFKAGETPTPGPAVQPSPIFPDLALPTPPSGSADDEKAWSHVATPGAVEVEHSAEPDAFSTPSSPTLPSFPATPSANAGDVPSAPTFDRSPSPSPSPDLPSAPPTQPISPDRPHAVQISPLPPSDLSAPPQPPSFPAPSPPPAPPPLAPPAPAKVPPPPAAAAPPPASVPSSSSQAPIDLPQAQIDKIQKHAKWAISALNYEDLDTARKELKEALRLLG